MTNIGMRVWETHKNVYVGYQEPLLSIETSTA